MPRFGPNGIKLLTFAGINFSGKNTSKFNPRANFESTKLREN